MSLNYQKPEKNPPKMGKLPPIFGKIAAFSMKLIQSSPEGGEYRELT
jgi:hypothetical protein